ncbi:MAG: acetolactate synthase small subunit [Bacteroidota bacterium]
MNPSDQQRYTIAVFTENVIGMLNRVCGIFSRRKINIESITVSESEIDGIHRYTIVVMLTEDRVKKLVSQLEKQVEVVKARYHIDAETVYQEIALYKLHTKIMVHGGQAEKIVRAHHARVLSVEPDFTVLEKTGHKEDTQRLFDELKPYGILEFVRSGRVAIAKPMRTLLGIINEIENEH